MKFYNFIYVAYCFILLFACTGCADESVEDNSIVNHDETTSAYQDSVNSSLINQADGTYQDTNINSNDDQSISPQPPSRTTSSPVNTNDRLQTINEDIRAADDVEQEDERIEPSSYTSSNNTSPSDTTPSTNFSKYKIDLFCSDEIYVNDTFLLNLILKKILSERDSSVVIRPNQIQTSKQVVLNRGKRIKIKLEHAGLTLINNDKNIEDDCIYLNEIEDKLERQYKLVANERGKKQISATVYVLRDNQSCNELSTHTLVAETLELTVDVNYCSSLWMTLWEQIQKFWAALLIAVFTAILLFVKRKLKLKDEAKNKIENQ